MIKREEITINKDRFNELLRKEKYCTDARDLLSMIIDCGTIDVDAIIKLMNDFYVDIDIEELTCNKIKISCNSIIRLIFETVVREVCDELGKEYDDEKFNYYVNCLDSHLLFKNEEDEWIQAYDREDVEKYVSEYFEDE